VDEAAPIYYLEGENGRTEKRSFLILVSDNDIPGRRRQNELLIETMKTHGYEAAHIDYRVMEGYQHVEYVSVRDERGRYPYAELLHKFIEGI